MARCYVWLRKRDLNFEHFPLNYRQNRLDGVWYSVIMWGAYTGMLTY